MTTLSKMGDINEITDEIESNRDTKKNVNNYTVLNTTITGGTLLNNDRPNNTELEEVSIKINNNEIEEIQVIDQNMPGELETPINQITEKELVNNDLNAEVVENAHINDKAKVSHSTQTVDKDLASDQPNGKEISSCLENDKEVTIKPKIIIEIASPRKSKEEIINQERLKSLTNINNQTSKAKIVNSTAIGNDIENTISSQVNTKDNHTLPRKTKKKTQPTDPESPTKKLSPSLEREMWLVVNCCLHVSYFYLYLGVVLAASDLTALAKRYQQQEERHMKMAREIMSHLVGREAAGGLVDVSRPGVKCSSSLEALHLSQQLELWILERLEKVWIEARRKMDGAEDMLEQMLKEQKEQVLYALSD